jgi:hypothetical protein
MIHKPQGTCTLFHERGPKHNLVGFLAITCKSCDVPRALGGTNYMSYELRRTSETMHEPSRNVKNGTDFLYLVTNSCSQEQ